jgi:ligand-binding sensor domain-containing protein
LIVTCLVQKIFAQNPVVNLLQFSTEDGLDATEVMAIAEDDEGFLWLGTDHGLQRFDGSKLKVFLPDTAAKNSIPTEKVWKLLAGKNNKIWMSTRFDGLVVYDKLTSEFSSYQYKAADPTTIGGNELCGLLEDDGGIWVLSKNNCISFLSFTTGKFQRYYIPQPHPAIKGNFLDMKSDVIQDKWNRNLMWISTNIGLYKFFKNRGQFVHVPVDPEKMFLRGENLIQCLHQDQRGRVWCGLYYGISVFDPYSNNWSHYPYFKMPVTPKEGFRYSAIYPRTDSLLIVLTWPFHWFEFNLDSKKWSESSVRISNRFHSADLSESPDLLLLSSCMSRDGAIWLGSYYTVSMENLRPMPFYTAELVDSTGAALRGDNYPWSFFYLKQNREFLMGSGHADGLIHVENYQTGQSRPIHSTLPPDNDDNYLQVNSIVQKNDSSWWLATAKGLFEYKKGNKFFEPSINERTGRQVFSDPIQTLFADVDKTLWIGTTFSGLYHFFPKKNFIQHFEYDAKDSASLFGNESITSIIRGPDKKLWVGTLNCINIYDEKTEKFAHLDHSVPGVPRDEQLRVNDIDLDAAGRAWVGTAHGLVMIRFVNNGYEAKTFSFQDGLSSNQIHKLLVDKRGNIWLTTDNSLSYFNSETRNFINFSQRDGIAHISGSELLEQMPNGIIVYGMWNSLLWFHPDSITNYRPLPKPYLFRLQLNDIDYTGRDLNQMKQLNLSYKQRNISFQLGGLGLSGNFRHYFAYRLVGYDNDWIYAGQRNYVNYTHLPAGKYRFQYKVANSMGQWNPMIKEISIFIRPALWQTWWFLGSAIFVVTAFIYFFVRKRIKAIRKEAGLKQKMAEAEMMALRAQMNPHFIFNSLNSIDNLIQTDQKEKATLYLSKFAKLLRAILENSKHELIPCWKDLETLQLYLELEKLRWDKKFISEVIVDDKIFQGDYKVPPMVIQPFVENAIHHGLLNKEEDDRKLFVSIKPEDGYLKYVIEDNGVGRTKAEEYKKMNRPAHNSMGLQITTQRIHLFNQEENGSVKITDLYNDQQQPAGTKVEICLYNQN